MCINKYHGFWKAVFSKSSSSCQCFSDLSIPASSERQSNAAPSVNTFIEGLLETFGEQYFSYIGKTLSCSPSISFDNRNATSNAAKIVIKRVIVATFQNNPQPLCLRCFIKRMGPNMCGVGTFWFCFRAFSTISRPFTHSPTSTRAKP